LVASSSLNPKFSICCGQGAVRLTPLSVPPDGLRELFEGHTSNSKRFLANTRSFNSAFAFVSLGCKVDNKFPGYRGPPTFRIHGELYHRIGSLIPPSNQDPMFSQIYFYDSSYDSQVARRLQFIRQRGQRYQTNMNDRDRDRDCDIIIKLQEIMSTVNPYAKQFKHQGDRFRPHQVPMVSMKIVARTPQQDQRRYNAPTADEVAVIIPGDGTNGSPH